MKTENISVVLVVFILTTGLFQIEKQVRSVIKNINYTGV
jgi:hypothetical protein